MRSCLGATAAFVAGGLIGLLSAPRCPWVLFNVQQQASGPVNTAWVQTNNNANVVTPGERPVNTAWRPTKYTAGVVTTCRNLPLLFFDQRLQVAGDIYEFGVFNGGSLQNLRNVFPESRIWGFDSFAGLPDEPEDVQQNDFGKGNYAAKETPKSLTEKLGGPSRAGFVVGFYDKVLTMSLRAERGMSQAMFIHIDADLYTSSLQALQWSFRSGLVRPGTLIWYDDWWVNSCSRGGEQLHPLSTSEGRAHAEIAQAFRVKFRCVSGGCRFSKSEAKKHCEWAPIFIVDALLGETPPTHGFQMSENEIREWKALNPMCQRHLASPNHMIKNKSKPA